MIHHQQQGAASAVPNFDPSAWLTAWGDHGGIAMLIGDRLSISYLAAVDRSSLTALDTLRGHLNRPGAPTALAGLLRANAGEMR